MILTPEEIQHRLSLASDQSQQPQQGGQNKIERGLGDFVVGTGKGLASTIINSGSLMAKGFDYLTAGGKNVASIKQTQQGFNTFNAPKTLGEKLGFGAEQTAEYLAPTGIESGISKAIGATSKLGKIATAGAVTGLSTGAVNTLQTGGNVKEGIKATLLGGAAGVAAKSLEVFGPTLIKELQKQGFKLSPTKAAQNPQKIEEVAGFMTDNNISGSSGSKYSQLVGLNNKLESTLQKTVGQNITIKKADLIGELRKIPTDIQKSDPAIYSKVLSDVNDAIATLEATPGSTLNTSELLLGKRSFGKSAFGKSTATKFGQPVTSVGDYAIEQAYQDALGNALTMNKKSIDLPKSLQSFFGGKSSVTLPEFNKVYSNAITARKIMGLAKNKNTASLIGRLFPLWVGRTVGHAIAPGVLPEIIGATAGEVGATRIPGALRYLTEKAVRSGNAIVPITKTGLGGTSMTRVPKNP